MEHPKEVSRKVLALELTKLLHLTLCHDTSVREVPGVQEALRSKLGTETSCRAWAEHAKPSAQFNSKPQKKKQDNDAVRGCSCLMAALFRGSVLMRC